MEFQRRHTPHLVIIFVTMFGTVYFFHKQDQLKARQAAIVTSEINLNLKPKNEKKLCEKREDGYRCYSKKNVSKQEN